MTAPLTAKPLDIAALDSIRTARIEDLRDRRWLEHSLLPELGLNDDLVEEFPSHLHRYCGKGLRHWQYPCQFAPYLATLSEFEIASYLEIGIRHGGTFLITIEYLSRFNRVDRAVGIDVVEAPFIASYAARNRGKTTIVHSVVDTQLADNRELVSSCAASCDLVLIDGAHGLQGCQSDLELVRPHASIVVLHDIVSSLCPGVQEVWRRFREEGEGDWIFLEFTDQYDEVLARARTPYRGMGIGMALRRDRRSLPQKR